jgi:F-type H+-transporting ATPase subunit b
MLSLEPGMLIWTWVTFIFVALALWKFAWKPLLSAVEARENHISDSIKKSESARAEAEKLLAQQQEKLASAQKEIQNMMKEAKQLGEKMRSDMAEQARAEAEKIKERAKADIEKERQMVIASLKKEVADIVVDATSKLVGVVVDKTRHQKIIDESIAGFGRKN